MVYHSFLGGLSFAHDSIDEDALFDVVRQSRAVVEVIADCHAEPVVQQPPSGLRETRLKSGSFGGTAALSVPCGQLTFL